MDDNEKYKAVDKFLEDIYTKGQSDVVCPICKTSLKLNGDTSGYIVTCQTEHCLCETFRGI